MKKVLTILIVLAFACSVYGQQVGISWVGQYRLYGFEVYDEKYVHPGITADLGGAEVSTITHFREDEDWSNWDTKVNCKLPIGGLYARPGFGYYMLPGENDVQEYSITVGIDGNVSPRYTFAHVVPEGDEGQIHVVGLDYKIGCPDKIQACFSADVTYNDGVNPMGGAAVKDWTHTNLGAQLKIPVAGFDVLPGVVWQHTMEESIEPDENEVWATLSVVRRF